MSRSVNCPHCDEEVHLRPGRATDCPTCGAQVQIPTARRRDESDDVPRPSRKYRREWDDAEPARPARRGVSRAWVCGLIVLLGGGVVIVGGTTVAVLMILGNRPDQNATATHPPATRHQPVLIFPPNPPRPQLPPQKDIEEPWGPNPWVDTRAKSPPARRAPAQPAAHTYPATAPFDVDPRLLKAGERVYLDELEPFAVKQGPWQVGRGGALGSYDNEWVVVNKVYAEHGMGMHPPVGGSARASFALGGKVRTLKGHVALNDSWEGNPDAPTTFAVFLDGEEVWRSASVMRRGTTVPFRINVTGVKVLTIETHAPGDQYRCHCVWLDPVLEK